MRISLALVWGCLFSWVVILQAQSTEVAIRRAGGQGWGKETAYGKLFNPGALETLRGKVISVDRFTPFRQMGYGFLVLLQTPSGPIDVHVGPGWYVTQQGFELSPGDEIVVRGSRITFEDKPAIMAIRIQKGQRVLELRGEDGTPVWMEEEEG